MTASANDESKTITLEEPAVGSTPATERNIAALANAMITNHSMTRHNRRRGGDGVVTISSLTDVNTFITIVESLENQKPVMPIVSAGSPMLMGQMQGAVFVNGRGGACNRNNISSFINSDHADYSAPGTAWHSAVD